MLRYTEARQAGLRTKCSCTCIVFTWELNLYHRRIKRKKYLGQLRGITQREKRDRRICISFVAEKIQFHKFAAPRKFILKRRRAAYFRRESFRNVH